MSDAAEVERALNELVASGKVEVHENGRWLAALSDLRFEVRSQGAHALIHLWSEERNLVRRILRVAECSADHLLLEVQRFGRSKPDTLEFILPEAERSPQRRSREKFRERFRQLLAEQFPDEPIDSLAASADLEHSLSGCFVRGVLHRGSQAWAVMAAAPGENAVTIDSILTFALVWLDRSRQLARGRSVVGLRLFLPQDSSRITAHRLSALDPATHIELYELQETRNRAQRIDPGDIGNLATWLTPRREAESALAEARAEIERIRRLAPGAITAGVSPGTRDVSMRFRGLEFARRHGGKIHFGVGDQRKELTAQNERELKRLVEQLKKFRHAQAQDVTHPLYRAQPERWLEALVQEDVTRVDARLDSRHLYTQVPAFAAGDRGVIDLLGATRDGRLAVIELKAAEDIHLALQAVDYWLRVRWHHRQEDFQRYGYFPGIDLQPKPPLLFLVAPGFQFHPASDVILRYLSREVQATRVGLNETWRRGLRVVFRQ